MLGTLTYLVFELGWALPVLALQWGVGWRRLWCRRISLVTAVGVSTLYLVCIDSIAIAQHIWTLHPNRIIGIAVGNVPVEEAIFFLVTNAMVVQSVILALPRPGRRL